MGSEPHQCPRETQQGGRLGSDQSAARLLPRRQDHQGTFTQLAGRVIARICCAWEGGLFFLFFFCKRYQCVRKGGVKVDSHCQEGMMAPAAGAVQCVCALRVGVAKGGRLDGWELSWGLGSGGALISFFPPRYCRTIATVGLQGRAISEMGDTWAERSTTASRARAVGATMHCIVRDRMTNAQVDSVTGEPYVGWETGGSGRKPMAWKADGLAGLVSAAPHARRQRFRKGGVRAGRREAGGVPGGGACASTHTLPASCCKIKRQKLM